MNDDLPEPPDTAIASHSLTKKGIKEILRIIMVTIISAVVVISVDNLILKTEEAWNNDDSIMDMIDSVGDVAVLGIVAVVISVFIIWAKPVEKYGWTERTYTKYVKITKDEYDDVIKVRKAYRETLTGWKRFNYSVD